MSVNSCWNYVFGIRFPDLDTLIASLSATLLHPCHVPPPVGSRARSLPEVSKYSASIEPSRIGLSAVSAPNVLGKQ